MCHGLLDYSWVVLGLLISWDTSLITCTPNLFIGLNQLPRKPSQLLRFCPVQSFVFLKTCCLFLYHILWGKSIRCHERMFESWPRSWGYSNECLKPSLERASSSLPCTVYRYTRVLVTVMVAFAMWQPYAQGIKMVIGAGLGKGKWSSEKGCQRC